MIMRELLNMGLQCGDNFEVDLLNICVPYYVTYVVMNIEM